MPDTLSRRFVLFVVLAAGFLELSTASADEGNENDTGLYAPDCKELASWLVATFPENVIKVIESESWRDILNREYTECLAREEKANKEYNVCVSKESWNDWKRREATGAKRFRADSCRELEEYDNSPGNMPSLRRELAWSCNRTDANIEDQLNEEIHEQCEYEAGFFLTCQTPDSMSLRQTGPSERIQLCYGPARLVDRYGTQIGPVRIKFWLERDPDGEQFIGYQGLSDGF